MKNLKNEKAITLVALVITIIILLILASIATYSGASVIKSSKFTKFQTELKIMQMKTNEWYEQYKNEEKNNIISKLEAYETLPTDSIISFAGAGVTNDGNYLYFPQSTIKKLNIENIDGEFLINIKNRSVISYEGFTYEGMTYYTLNQIPNGLYNVKYEDKNTGKPTFDTSWEDVRNGKSKIKISNIQYETGYINKWQVQYQKNGEDNWKTTEDLNFNVNENGLYKIKIVNDNIESEEQELVVANYGYATDGLVLHLDGINNTGEGDEIHSEDATTWKDLSNNNNNANFIGVDTTSTFTSGWQNDSIALDGVNDYAEIADSETMKPTSQTIEIVFDRTGKASSDSDSSSRGIIFVRWNGYTVETNAINEINQFTVSYGRNSGYLQTSGKLDLNKKYLLSATHENNKSKIFVNSENNGEQNVIPSGYSGMNTTIIGQYNRSNYTKCKIYSIRMYNRALTDEEIKNNYDIDKERFNIEE